jgi:ubiquinone/menaquinone biosynthesis C-methylase UbiE
VALRAGASFDHLAPTYDRWRPLLAADTRRLRFMLERCPLPPRATVLEVGCGTGRLLREVANIGQAAVAIGVDPEPAMLSAANDVETRLGRAESLPVDGESVDLAFMSLVLHLVDDRAAAARELYRVLRARGSAAVWTLTPEHVVRFHLNRYFPTLPKLDLRRFEAPERWLGHLLAAGFDPVCEAEMVTVRRTTARRLAAAVRARYISTLSLLPPAEFESGVRRLEAEAADNPQRRVTYRQVWCLLWARK